MGIVDLWKLISPSERKYTLEQLSIDTETKRKGQGLRVAVDVAIWAFQARSSVVGDQSELRAMFFRLNRLYELGIRPVFVFDGPNRPDYKRSKAINTSSIETTFIRNLKTLVKLFHFSIWEAYGEAEAECAMLERLGFVDVIFTGDSDCFLFGARRVVRQWPPKRSEPVLCYDTAWIHDYTGLDRSDLILIALLRGSDYDTTGTRGIGIKVAAQLTKCHFHRTFLDEIQLAGRDHDLDEERVQHLFNNLTYELHNNGTKNLSRKHSAVTLDRKFFEFKIVTDFINPITHIADKDHILLAKELKRNLDYYFEPNWIDLAAFTQHAFCWPAEYVLKRFSKLLYPGYMANKLRRQQPNYTIPPPHPHGHYHQSKLQDYYRSTPRLHKAPHIKGGSDILIQITSSKLSKDGLKQYRVEWDKSTWIEFQNKLRQKLNFAIFQDRIIMDEEVLLNDKEGSEDLFQQVKRQWVDATHVHNSYSSIALEYQNKTGDRRVKNNTSSQTKTNSFLIIPPKRIINSRQSS